MTCYHTSCSRSVYRSRRNRVIAGVCGGLAEHFGVSATLLRICLIVGAVMTSFSLVPILYVICIFVMPLEEPGMRGESHARQSVRRPKRSKVRDREEALAYLSHQFDLMEQKIRGMEDHVTSREYVLRRKFDEL